MVKAKVMYRIEKFIVRYLGKGVGAGIVISDTLDRLHLARFGLGLDMDNSLQIPIVCGCTAKSMKKSRR